MILPVDLVADGTIAVNADATIGGIVIRQFSRPSREVVKRVLSIAEARAFMEYLDDHLSFKCCEDITVRLTETSRDQLMIDLDHAIGYLLEVD